MQDSSYLLADGLPGERGLIPRKRHLVVDNADRLAFLLRAEPVNRCRVCTSSHKLSIVSLSLPVAVSLAPSESELLAFSNLQKDSIQLVTNDSDELLVARL